MDPADPAAWPPEPWRLAAEAAVLVWRLRPQEAPWTPPPGISPVRIAGRMLVAAVWARYRTPGVLSYDELAVGLLAREGGRLAVTVPWIWVDSPVSLHAARTLWAIPKQPGRFHIWPEQPFRAELASAAASAEAEVEGVGPALPAPLPLRLAQAAPDGVRRTPAGGHARVGLARARWRSGGALAFLDGRRPWLALRLDDARLSFGRRTD